MGERGGQKNPPGNRLKRPRRAAEESHRNRRRAVVPGRIALGKRVFSPKIQPLKRPTEAPRAHLPAAARICEAAMAPGRVIFLVRRECARGGREGGRIGGRAGCSKDGQRGLKRVEKGREIAAYLSILALNSSDFAEIRRHSRAAFRRGRRWFRRGGSGTARSGWSPMGEGSVRAGLCDRPFSRKIRNGGVGAFPNAPCGMARRRDANAAKDNHRGLSLRKRAARAAGFARRGGGFSRAGESRKMEADASPIGRLS